MLRVTTNDNIVRTDISSDNVFAVFPMLPHKKDWEDHEYWVKLRYKYMMILDSLAYECCQTAFKRSTHVTISQFDRLWFTLEKLIWKIRKTNKQVC